MQLQEPQAHNLRPAQVQIAQALALAQLAEAGCAQALAALQTQPLQALNPCSASTASITLQLVVFPVFPTIKALLELITQEQDFVHRWILISLLPR